MYDVCTLCMMYVCMYLLDWARISRYIHHPYKSGVGAQSTNQHRLLCMAGCTTTNQTLRLLQTAWYHLRRRQAWTEQWRWRCSLCLALDGSADCWSSVKSQVSTGVSGRNSGGRVHVVEKGESIQSGRGGARFTERWLTSPAGGPGLSEPRSGFRDVCANDRYQ